MLEKHDKDSIGLIGHIITDYPDFITVRHAIEIMVKAGVALVELQIPFSEPIADGPLFTRANHEAIARGVTVANSFQLMREVNEQYDIPFVFMTYGNILYKMGYKKFVSRAKEVGAKGIIVPDLPVNQSEDLFIACQQQQLAWIQIIPPNVREERLKLLVSKSQGFIYLVARSGVTGDKTNFNDALKQFVQTVRQHTELPIAVGFGVTTSDDVAQLRPVADYAIVGSQALRVLRQKGLQAFAQFWQELKEKIV